MNATHLTRPRRPRFTRIIIWSVSVILALFLIVFIAFKVSPWPSVWYVRKAFRDEGRSGNEHLAPHVPAGISVKPDLWYDSTCNQTKLDLYYPLTENVNDSKYTVIIWIHGGGFVGGGKSELSNYCQILSSKGYIVAVPNYSLAPNEKYPMPVKQINRALAFLVRNAEQLNIDSSRIIVAGDSGGAHIAAQLANVFTSTEYAKLLNIQPSIHPDNLKGVILQCGPYNTDLVDYKNDFGRFFKVALWAYFGRKDFENDANYAQFSVANFVTAKFPPTFISVGNADPLKEHSFELASKLSSKGVVVDSLFFPDNFSPALYHEYQFDLDTKPGQLSLERTMQFVSRCTSINSKSISD